MTKQLYTMKELGLEGAIIINHRGKKRPLELDFDRAPEADNIWDWANLSLEPGEVILFGRHQAGRA